MKLLMMYSKRPGRSQWAKKDQPFIIKELSERGIDLLLRYVDDVLLDQNATKALMDSIPWREVAVIDYRYCRGIPRYWKSHYSRFFNHLHAKLDELAEHGHHIVLTPSIATLEWVLSKVKQIKTMESAGIPVIPHFIIPDDNGLQNRFDTVLNTLKSNQWVIKPEISSGGDRICFVNQSSSGFELTLYRVDFYKSKSKILKKIKTKESLVAYINQIYIPSDFPLLIQPLLNVKREVSAVYINRLPHFVERLTADEHHVAHERFAGRNIYVCKPDEAWARLAEQVFQAIPIAARNSVSLRIDLFETNEGQIYFSETEAASNRILLPTTLDYYREDITSPIQSINEQPPSFFIPLKHYVDALSQRLEKA